MLEKAAEHPVWKEKDQKKAEFDEANPGKKYGVGFAQVQKDYGTGADASALVLEFDADGRLTMRHCAQEIGTGATTAQQIMIGELIGKIPDDAVFAVTDFPELPLVSSYEAFTTSQDDEKIGRASCRERGEIRRVAARRRRKRNTEHMSRARFASQR